MVTGKSQAYLRGFLGTLAKLAAAVAPATATSPGYSVARGDTLSGIAKRNNTTTQELARLNGIRNPNRIMAGQKLRLPGKPAQPASAAPVAPASPAAETPASRMNYVASKLHANLNNPALEAGILANFDRETGGRFDYATKEVGGGGYGLPQYTGASLKAYRGWLANNKRQDSADSQIDYFTKEYMPSRSGYKTYTAPGAKYTREQYADWLHRKVFTPAHTIPGNKAYSQEKIDRATQRHNDFMQSRLQSVGGVWQGVKSAAARKDGSAYLRGFLVTLVKHAAMVAPPKPATGSLAPGAPPAPAKPVQATVPQIGVSVHGYGGPTAAARTYDTGAAAPVDGAQAQGAAASVTGAARDAASSGQYAASGFNYLASMPEFQRRVGGGDAARGRELVGKATGDLGDVRVVNEEPTRGAAISYTRNNGGSYIAAPAKSVSRSGRYRGVGDKGTWRKGMMTHEMAHPFTRKIPGYVDKIRTIQQQEGIQGTDQYHRTPKEQAAEFNALRVLRGAWPGHGAGPGGAYTPEQADSILDGKNPYFKGLPTNYKMRLLNEAKNSRGGAAPSYWMAQRAVV